jgi:hypothetical protein
MFRMPIQMPQGLPNAGGMTPGASPDLIRRLLLEQRRRGGQLPIEALRAAMGGASKGGNRIGLGRQNRLGFDGAGSHYGSPQEASLFQFPDDPSATTPPQEPAPPTPGPERLTPPPSGAADPPVAPAGPWTPPPREVAPPSPGNGVPSRGGPQGAPEGPEGFQMGVPAPLTPPHPGPPANYAPPGYAGGQPGFQGVDDGGTALIRRFAGSPQWGQPDNRLNTFRQLAQLRMQRLGM